MKYEKFKRQICLDFDGVIHRYSRGWKGGDIYDPPMDGALEGIRRLIEQHYTIVILTARKKCEHRKIKLWLKTHFGRYLADRMSVTNIKPPAVMYIDDRAYRFTNWTDVVNLFV